MVFVIAVVVAFALSFAYVRATQWRKEARTTRFVFEDCDTYLLLRLEQVLGSEPSDLVTMRALREALRLKLAGVGYQRLIVQASALRIADRQAFWLLIGALGPAFGNDQVKVALVCARRSQAEDRIRESGLLNPFPSIRDAENFLHSDQPAPALLLDRGQLDSLLERGAARAA